MQKIEISDISSNHTTAAHAVDWAINLLEVALAKPRFIAPKTTSRLYLEMRRDLPYAIHETSIPGTKIIVNRNYKPLGNKAKTGMPWVNYEDAIAGHVALNENQIESITGAGKRGYLFDDGNPPWGNRRFATSYLERLKKLREEI